MHKLGVVAIRGGALGGLPRPARFGGSAAAAWSCVRDWKDWVCLISFCAGGAAGISVGRLGGRIETRFQKLVAIRLERERRAQRRAT